MNSLFPPQKKACASAEVGISTSLAGLWGLRAAAATGWDAVEDTLLVFAVGRLPLILSHEWDPLWASEKRDGLSGYGAVSRSEHVWASCTFAKCTKLIKRHSTIAGLQSWSIRTSCPWTRRNPAWSHRTKLVSSDIFAAIPSVDENIRPVQLHMQSLSWT